eukprot:scaffold27045_cov95-Isochrysis_galbana.AAC.1
MPHGALAVHTGPVHTGPVHTGAVHTGAVHTGAVHTGAVHTGAVGAVSRAVERSGVNGSGGSAVAQWLGKGTGQAGHCGGACRGVGELEQGRGADELCERPLVTEAGERPARLELL